MPFNKSLQFLNHLSTTKLKPVVYQIDLTCDNDNMDIINNNNNNNNNINNNNNTRFDHSNYRYHNGTNSSHDSNNSNNNNEKNMSMDANTNANTNENANANANAMNNTNFQGDKSGGDGPDVEFLDLSHHGNKSLNNNHTNNCSDKQDIYLEVQRQVVHHQVKYDNSKSNSQAQNAGRDDNVHFHNDPSMDIKKNKNKNKKRKLENSDVLSQSNNTATTNDGGDVGGAGDGGGMDIEERGCECISHIKQPSPTTSREETADHH
jgi:hypothetical protein